MSLPLHICSASIVQNYRTFWVDVTSPALNFTNNSTSGSTSPTTTPTMTTDTSMHQPAPLSVSNNDDRDQGMKLAT